MSHASQEMPGELQVQAHHFDVVFWCHFLQALPCKGRHVDLGDHDSSIDALIPHALCICLYCLHAHLLLFWEEHKHLQASSSCSLSKRIL